MNIKNHTGLRPHVLSGDQGEAPAFAHSKALKFFTKDLPISIGRLAAYLVGFVVTVDATYTQAGGREADPTIDWDDVARSLFESCELKNSLLGKPISHNYFRGEFFGLFGFVGNGMKRAVPQPPFLTTNAGVPAVTTTQRHSWFIPACALLGMKGHHTAQLACLFDNGTFELKTAGAGVIPGLTIGGNGSDGQPAHIEVTAMLLGEPEIRLGPGTQFVRYASTVAASGTKHQIEALGNTTSLQGVEGGAGIAFLAWMSSRRGYGGSFANAYQMEYANLPFRGLDQLIHLDGLYLDYLGSCGATDASGVLAASAVTSANQAGHAGPFAGNGLLYGPTYTGKGRGLVDADFIPLISPRSFMETSKMQSVEGTVDLHSKCSASFSGDDVFVALQFHSWTPAQQEEVFKKIVSSGLANTVWGTPNLVPSTKIVNKQPAGSINPSKTRYFAHTWAPAETQPNPPSQAPKA
jgi:hypothetical protein